MTNETAKLALPLGPDHLVEEVVRDFPKASAFLRRWGIVCIQCGEPVWGTLGEVIEAKGQDVGHVLDQLNEYLAE
jgi:hypothetical protein